MLEENTKNFFTRIQATNRLNLYLAGKPRVEIIREYELRLQHLTKWVKQSKTSGSFKEKDNLTPEQKELLELRKRNQQLEMENQSLKQAALIFGRRDK